MATDKNLTIKINVKSDVSGGINQAMSSFRGMADKVNGSIGNVTRSIFNMKNAIVGAFTVGFIGHAIKAFGEAEAATAGLRSALQSVGADADGVTARMQAVSQQIQQFTVFEDDAVVASSRLAVQMGVGADQLENVAKAAAALGSRFGDDLTQSTQAVVRAMGGQWRELQRLYPEIAAANTQSEKMAILNEKIAQGMDQARDRIHTTMGAWKQFQNVIGDVWEAVGEGILKGIGSIAGFQGKTQELVAFLSGPEFKGAIIETFANIVGAAVEFGKAIWEMMKTVIGIFKDFYDILKFVWEEGSNDMRAAIVVMIAAVGGLALALIAMEHPILAVVAAIGLVVVAGKYLAEGVAALGIVFTGLRKIVADVMANMVRVVGLGFNRILQGAEGLARALGMDDVADKIAGWEQRVLASAAGIAVGLESTGSTVLRDAIANYNRVVAENERFTDRIAGGFLKAKAAYDQIAGLAGTLPSVTAGATMTAGALGNLPTTPTDGEGGGGSARDAARTAADRERDAALKEFQRQMEAYRKAFEQAGSNAREAMLTPLQKLDAEVAEALRAVHNWESFLNKNALMTPEYARSIEATTEAILRYQKAQRFAFAQEDLKRQNELLTEQAAALGKIGAAAREALDAYLKDSSPMAAITDRYNEVIAKLDEARIKGALTAEEFGAAMGRAREQFEKEWNPVAQAAEWGKSFEDMAAQVAGTMQSSLSDAMVASIKGNDVAAAWNSFLVNMGNSLLKTVFDAVSTAIIQASGIQSGIQSGISALFGGGGKGGAKGGGGGLGFLSSIAGFLGFAEGGLVPALSFAGGGMVTGGFPGRDSVPAFLTPGERVLTVAQNRDFERGGDTYVTINATDAQSFYNMMATPQGREVINSAVIMSKQRNGAARHFERSGF